jgi:hypothetical protein
MQRRGVKKLHRISNHCSLKLFHNLCHGFFFFFFFFWEKSRWWVLSESKSPGLEGEDQLGL